MTKSKVMSGFKGFDKDLKCRDFQFKVGKSFKEDEAVLCRKGFHFCEFPLDVFNYYPPSGSRFCDITGSDVLNQTESDSKRCAKRIKIKTEIGLKGLVDASIKFIYEKIDWVNAKESNTGDQSAATNTGDQSAATNTGNRSAATNTGDQSAATNTGYQSAATNTGSQSAATNTGNRSAATNTGNRSAATNTGDQSAATNTGDQSAATNTGNRSAATNTGNRSAATNTGDQSAATNTGYRSAATNTGDQSAATVNGDDSVACSIGYKGTASASLGSAIVLAERDDNYKLITIKSAIIDGVILKANVFYTLIDGEFVEV